MLGDSKKISLIKNLIQERVKDLGFAEPRFQNHIRKMSESEIIDSPEYKIFTLVEIIKKFQDKGALLKNIFPIIEDHRKRWGHDPHLFKQIIEAASGGSSGASGPMYALYRIHLEAPGSMSDAQVIEAFAQATDLYYAPKKEGWTPPETSRLRGVIVIRSE